MTSRERQHTPCHVTNGNAFDDVMHSLAGGAHSVYGVPLGKFSCRKQGIAPRGRQDDMPLADGSSTVTHRFVASQATMDPKLAADLRPSADRSAVRTFLVAGGG